MSSIPTELAAMNVLTAGFDLSDNSLCGVVPTGIRTRAHHI